MENNINYEELQKEANKTAFIGQCQNICKRPDGTFVVDYNGLPYAVTEEMGLEFEALTEYEKKNPDKVKEYVEPVWVEPEEQKAQRLLNEATFQRQALLDAADVALMKHQEKCILENAPECNEYKIAIYKYKQVLRDITKTPGWPQDPDWPIIPRCEDYHTDKDKK